MAHISPDKHTRLKMLALDNVVLSSTDPRRADHYSDKVHLP